MNQLSPSSAMELIHNSDGGSVLKAEESNRYLEERLIELHKKINYDELSDILKGITTIHGNN